LARERDSGWLGYSDRLDMWLETLREMNYDDGRMMMNIFTIFMTWEWFPWQRRNLGSGLGYGECSDSITSRTLEVNGLWGDGWGFALDDD